MLDGLYADIVPDPSPASSSPAFSPPGPDREDIETHQNGADDALSVRLYTTADLVFFHRLTGYTLALQGRMLRSIDKAGNRAVADDRLFTVLAEEAFQLADRQRRSGPRPDRDLTVDDLTLTLFSMRRAAAAIGSKGLVAFERLETAIAMLDATPGPASDRADAVGADTD